MGSDFTSGFRDALLDFLAPLDEAANNPAVLQAWLAQLGHTAAISGAPELREIFAHAGVLRATLAGLNPSSLQTLAGLQSLLQSGREVSTLVEELRQFGNDPARANVAAKLAEEVMALLLASYLRRNEMPLFRAASVLTLIASAETSLPTPAIVVDGAVVRNSASYDEFNFSAVSALIADPGPTLEQYYFPNNLAQGQDAWLAAARLFGNLGYFCNAVGVSWSTSYVPSAPSRPDSDVVGDGTIDGGVAEVGGPPQDTDITDGADEGATGDSGDTSTDVGNGPDDSGTDSTGDNSPDDGEDDGGIAGVPDALPDSYFSSYFPGFRLVLLKSTTAPGSEAALELQCSSSSHPGATPGYILSLVGSFDTVTIFDSWRLTLAANGQVPAFVLKPSGFALVPNAVPLTGGTVKILLERLPAAGSAGPVFLFGSTGGTRLEFGSAILQADFSYDPTHIAAAISAKAAKCSFVIHPGDGDSFLSSVLPANGLSADFDLGLIYSSDGGLAFQGGAGLEATLPVSLSLAGVVALQGIHLALTVDGSGATAETSAIAALNIGPVHVVVERMGMLATVAFPASGGNLGLIDLQVGFKLPSGVGLAIDVAGLGGGGYLTHDDAKHEYAGVLQLDFHSYKLTAFGLLATVLPTGSGYSLIAMVDAEFPPIELGLGFTLDGVGGLLGVHRMASVDALRAALTAHTLSNLLFPKNPIANASQLLTELDTLFPAAVDRFIFGPIVRIEWGTPALLTLDLALILELPDPVRLVLISELTVLLPTPDEKLVEIHMSALGTIDFGTCEGALDAVLHDSRLMKFVLHGSMALRVNWSGQKTSLLAVGGVHPKFQLPPGFPKLDRVGISMPSGHVAKLNLDSYLAVTSNTLQIGAHVDIFVGIDGFGISGYLTFDTLIQRHPFHFDGDISGGIALSVDGHDLMALRMTGSLTGPAPWNAAGSVSFDVLWWSVTKSFSETFGDTANTPPLDQVDVGQLLRAALSDARNFAGLFAPNVSALVTLKAPVAATTVVLAHPGASLSVHQTVVPLGLSISKYGGSAPLGETRFDITSMSADGVAQVAPALAPLLDDFAPAQYLTLSDDDKLASPSFERLAAGVELDGTTIFGAPMTRTVAYDTFLVDTPDGLPREERVPTPFPLGVLTGVLLDGSAGRSLFARAASRRYAGPRHLVMPAELDFVVATSDQLTASGVGASAGMSYRQARAALDMELALHPERSGELLVAARYEVAA